MTLTMVDLFAGFGAFSLAGEAAGFTPVLFCERDPYCQRVLAKHWPEVPCAPDIWTLTGDVVRSHDIERVDVLAAAPPCQPVSFTGKRRGAADDRWLWPQVVRLVREVRPRFVVVENVPGLLTAGFGDILGGLAACGYDAEWDCLPASAFGAYHERDRLFIVAYPTVLDGDTRGVLETLRDRSASLQSGRLHRMALATRGERCNERLESEPGLARLVHGVPHRTHRLQGLGNAIYPAVAHPILAAIAAEMRGNFT